LRQRIDRVLDESIRLSRGLSKGRWLALSLLSAVMLCGVAAFQLEAVPGPTGAYARWLEEDVAYIISDEEWSAFLQLTTAEEQDAFIEQFWLRRDPTTGTAGNEYKEEHYRRIAYASARYPTSIQPGWRSDRGRVYIIFGPPDEIESHPAGDGTSPPYEIWRYPWIENIGENVALTFYDPERTGEYRLLQPDLVISPGQDAGSVQPIAVSPDAPEAAANSCLVCSVSVRLRPPGDTPFFLARIEVVLGEEELGFHSEDGFQKAVVYVYGRVTSADRRPIHVFEDVLTVARAPGVPRLGRSLYRKFVPLGPGSYSLSIVAKETASGRTESKDLSFTVPAGE